MLRSALKSRTLRTIVNIFAILAFVLGAAAPVAAQNDQTAGGSATLSNDGDSLILYSSPYTYRISFYKDAKNPDNNSASVLRYMDVGTTTVEKEDNSFSFCGWGTFFAGRMISAQLGWWYQVDCQQNDNGLRVEVFDEEVVVTYSAAYSTTKK